MKRRQFIKGLIAGTSAVAASQSGAADTLLRESRQGDEPQQILLQHSPIAGFQFYEGKQLWQHLKVGQTLALVREPHNPHDDRAVEVYWDDPTNLGCIRDLYKLGYLPRRDNCAVHQLMDRGEEVVAKISELRLGDDPWERIRVSVILESSLEEH